MTTRSAVPRSQFGSRMYSPLCRAAHRDAIHPQRWLPDADRHALAVLAAGADAWIERKVVTDHGNAVQICGSIANEHRAFDRCGDLAVLDLVGLGALKD